MVHESLDISKVHNILDKEEAIEAVWGRLGVDQTLERSAAARASVCLPAVICLRPPGYVQLSVDFSS